MKYNEFLSWKSNRNKMRKTLTHTLDSKYNDYAGRYKGRLLSPRMWAVCNYKKDYVLVSNENFLKQFCQLDTMIHDKQFLHFIKNLVLLVGLLSFDLSVHCGFCGIDRIDKSLLII